MKASAKDAPSYAITALNAVQFLWCIFARRTNAHNAYKTQKSHRPNVKKRARLEKLTEEALEKGEPVALLLLVTEACIMSLYGSAGKQSEKQYISSLRTNDEY